LKCAVCRGPVNLKRVIDYYTFVRVHMPEKKAELGLEDEDGVVSETDSITDSEDDDDWLQGRRAGYVDDELDNDDDMRDFIVDDDVVDSEASDEDYEEEGRLGKEAKPKEKKGKEKDDDRNGFIVGGDDASDDDFDDIMRRSAKRGQRRAAEPKDTVRP